MNELYERLLWIKNVLLEKLSAQSLSDKDREQMVDVHARIALIELNLKELEEKKLI